MRPILLFCMAALALLVLGARPAHAAERAVYVLGVGPGIPEVDPAQLRTAIGAELQADVVSPDDARAASARGRIDVVVDRTTAQLVVSYDGGAEPLVRRVPLPPDARATMLAAVLLASNLARDEAGELAAQLRRSKPAPPPPPPGPTPDELEEQRQNEILRRMLSEYADHDGGVRRVTGWTSIGLAAAALGGGAAVFAVDRNSTWVVPVASVGIPFAILGVVELSTPSPFEELRDYYDSQNTGGGSPSWLRAEVEQRWKRDAEKARQGRTWVLVSTLGAGAIDVALSSFLLADDLHASTAYVAVDVAGIGVGLGLAVYGVIASQTETPIERRLHDYERAVGHPIELTDVGLRLAPVPGGMTMGLGGRF